MTTVRILKDGAEIMPEIDQPTRTCKQCGETLPETTEHWIEFGTPTHPRFRHRNCPVWIAKVHPASSLPVALHTGPTSSTTRHCYACDQDVVATGIDWERIGGVWRHRTCRAASAEPVMRDQRHVYGSRVQVNTALVNRAIDVLDAPSAEAVVTAAIAALLKQRGIDVLVEEATAKVCAILKPLSPGQREAVLTAVQS